MNPFYSGYIHRLRTTLVTGYDPAKIPEWMVENTTDPMDPHRKWSFKDHEFQIPILSDPARDVWIQKCSQVGLSELVVRLSIAILMMLRGGHGILTLPAQAFARQFARTRIQPVLDSSSSLREFCGMRDSTELKRIGNCFLWIRGTRGQQSAISVPAEFVINDEVDFSDQEVISTYSSRLRHSNLKIRRRLSTPSTSKFGVNKGFVEGSQGYYMVCCSKCETWVSPRPFEHVVIPGFDQELREFRKEHAESGTVNFSKAFVRCPNCSRPIRESDFATPARRAYVHAYPDRESHSYQVFPWDVPAYNPLPEILRSIKDYRTASLYYNFVWGVPFEDAENSFLADVVLENSVLRRHGPEQGKLTNCFMGVDIGKVSWVTIGFPNELGGLDVVCRKKLLYSPENTLVMQILAIHRAVGSLCTVIDAAPDFSTAKEVVAALPEGQAFGAYYAREGTTVNKMVYLEPNVEEGTLAVRRTASFDEMAKEVNQGKWRWQRNEKESEWEELREHVDAMRRVEKEDSSGIRRGYWESTTPDHYMHSAHYLRCAWLLTKEHLHPRPPLPLLMPTKAKLKETPFSGTLDNRR